MLQKKPAVKKVKIFIKNVILFLRPGVFFNFLSSPLLFAANTLRLTRWISQQSKEKGFNDFYRPFRDGSLRYALYQHVVTTEKLENMPIDYLEFGVFKGSSFKWWLDANRNENSRFYGFDTFAGLPESWGTYKMGDMTASIPEIDDPRHQFIKGLFQDTLLGFLENQKSESSRKKIIHMDADLFTSTLFVLTSLYRHLKDGDIILFDEYNVPNHEFFAFQCFTDSYRVKYELIGAVNNYFQVAFKIKK